MNLPAIYYIASDLSYVLNIAGKLENYGIFANFFGFSNQGASTTFDPSRRVNLNKKVNSLRLFKIN